MITAHEARQTADSAVSNAYKTKIFKHAMKVLEECIKDACSRGKHEICYNVCMFDICKFSSIEKDERATEADRAAIKTFMEDHGYTFFYHSRINISGHYNSCFTCKW